MPVINGKTLLAKAPIRGMVPHKMKAHGTSYGLGEAGYDIRIKQSVSFYPAGAYGYVPFKDEGGTGFHRKYYPEATVCVYDRVNGQPTFETSGGRFIIASAIEEFDMPADLVGVVHDKSTWARQGLSVFNTVIEPGWKGFLTLELVFHGNKRVVIPAGAGIAQVIFTSLAHDAYYEGKYQHQANMPVPSVFD